MMLVTALHHHEGALRASLLAAYGLRLVDARTWPMREVADLVAWLPAGCALWVDFGGPAALSEVVHAIRALDFSVRVLDYHEREGKGPKPKEPQNPPYATERRAENTKMSRKADAWRRREARRGA